MIEERNVVELYVMGRLPQELEEEFEEHYLDCEHCLRLIDENERFRDALRRAVVDRASAAKNRVWQLFVEFWQGISAGNRFAIGAAAVAVVIILSVLSLWVVALRHQLEAERLRASLAESGRTGAASAQLAEAQRLLQEERDLWSVPLANTPILVLEGVRRGGPSSSQQATVLTLNKDSRLVVLSANLESSLPYTAYRAALLDNSNQVVWHTDQLQPSRYNTLNIAVSSSFLRPGQYELRVEGLDRTGNAHPVDSYRFTAVKN